MISGPNDTVITPWQSAHLGFYDENEIVQPFEKQQVSQKKIKNTTKISLQAESYIYYRTLSLRQKALAAFVNTEITKFSPSCKCTLQVEGLLPTGVT